MTGTSDSRSRKGWLAGVIIAVLSMLSIVVLVFGFIKPSIHDAGVTHQNGLNAEYGAAAAALSKCLTTSTQTAQVASANAKAFQDVIRATVADTSSPTAHVDLKSEVGRSTLLPILAQAWPDVTKQAELFDKVITVVVDCQGEFRGAQNKVQDRVRSFDTWRQGYWVSMLGASAFPNDDLIVSIGSNQKITGLQALTKMRTPIVSEDAGDAYKNGTFKPADLFPQNTATPTPTR